MSIATYGVAMYTGAMLPGARSHPSTGPTVGEHSDLTLTRKTSRVRFRTPQAEHPSFRRGCGVPRSSPLSLLSKDVFCGTRAFQGEEQPSCIHIHTIKMSNFFFADESGFDWGPDSIGSLDLKALL